MFDIGPEKLLVIFVAVFIFVGPKELPTVARKIGAGMRQLRSLQDSVRTEVDSALALPSADHQRADAPIETAPDADHGVARIEGDETRFGAGPSSFR